MGPCQARRGQTKNVVDPEPYLGFFVAIVINGGHMADIDHDEAYWLSRSQEARDLAEKMIDPYTRNQMIIIAESYVLLARHCRAQVELKGKYNIPDRLK
jgi:hypothetical protein